ncbi:uncharacterized protein IL334_006169 [Kwoniella shivajii]|uniref:Large ribosomal subunit protein mL59 domain-containing protein n=1 Tax=Kwoniella shivajii TaxID=564305 RepID=A0ABZ1D729_9TREE|nr:hypothetical protein IL334_006169 [Kwoniella shivajii]
MNALSKRLFSTSSIVRSTFTESALPLDVSSPIQAKHLPRVLHRRIAKRLFQIAVTEGQSPSDVPLPNPFLVQKGNRRSDSEVTGEARYHWKRPIISNRRQKQLLQFYPAVDLPISDKSSASSSSSSFLSSSSRPVKWDEGTTVNWTGELKVKEEPTKNGVYAGRKRMFKGHKDERNREQKIADRQVRLDGMEKRIKEWRQGRSDEKIRNRPSLPF